MYLPLHDSLSACYRRIQENRKLLMKARREGDRTPYICVLFQMLCDWLILTWHLSLTLERAIKPLSEGLIERSTQIAHIWGFNEGWNNENNIVFTYIYDFHFFKKYGSFWKYSDLAVLFFSLEVLTFVSDELHCLNIATLLKQRRRNWIVSVLYKFV